MEELKYLRDKVNQLEEMVFKINDKLELALSSFLSHRADQVDGQKKLLQADQDACRAILSQFKSNVLPETTRNTRLIKSKSASISKSVPNNVYLPRRKTKEIAQTRRQSTRIVTKAAAPEPDLLISDSNHSFDDGEFDPFDLEPINAANTDTSLQTQEQKTLKTRKSDCDDHDSEYLPAGKNIIVKTELEYGDNQEMTVNQDDQDSSSDFESSPDHRDSTEHRKSKSSLTCSTQRRRRIYTLSQTFDNEDDARAHVKSEGHWSPNQEIQTQEGKKIYYRCKFNHRKCPARLYLQEVLRRRNEFELYRSDVEHVHPSGGRLWGLPAVAKTFIDDVFQNGLTKPGLIIREMRRQNLVEIPKRQLINYIAQLRSKRYGDLSFMKGPPKRKRKPRIPTGRRRGRPAKTTLVEPEISFSDWTVTPPQSKSTATSSNFNLESISNL